MFRYDASTNEDPARMSIVVVSAVSQKRKVIIQSQLQPEPQQHKYCSNGQRLEPYRSEARTSQIESHLSINPSQKRRNKEKESSFSVTITVFLWIRAKEPYQKERDYQKGRNQADKKFHTQGGERTSQISLLQTSHKGRMLENDSVLFDV